MRHTQAAGCGGYPLSEIVTDALSNAELPERFSLSHNYPNPFNPSTTIRYELPRSSMVRLTVYDILGREVCILVNERKNAGSYEVRVNASGLASGAYLYRITAEDFVQSKSFIILK